MASEAQSPAGRVDSNGQYKCSQNFIGAHNETLSVAMCVYEVRPRKDKRGVDLISDVLPFHAALVRRY
jgi:hypothetical protein